MTLRLVRWLLPAALCLLATGTALAAGSSAFPRPGELERDIAFWRRIYTEVSTDGGLIHDPERLDVVYEVLEFPDNISPRQRSKEIDDTKRKYTRILERLAAGATELSREEERVRDLWPEGTRRSRFEQAAEEVRFQLGQSDRFREGVIRSGAYRDYIAATFEKMGLPTELAVLPHVESSFNTYAYSKVGAAGMWQFMRSTGRRFLRIDSAVDERLDPYRATEAAARFLEQNYIVLGSWPLALTAYNHGPGGMRRAQQQTGTSDIATIVRNYESRTFGFASRNFYVAFLAALEIDTDPERFFGAIKRNPIDNSKVVTLTDFIPANRLASVLDVDRETLRRLNPALLPSVWNGARHVPRGYDFRVPPHVDLTAMTGKIGSADRYVAQVTDSKHRVRRGETLAAIASKYGTTTSRLASANDLRRPYRIRPGQMLSLPGQRTEGGGQVAKVDKVDRVDKADKEPTQSARAAPSTGVTGSASDRYIVRRGDTLSRIATANGMSEQALMELNSIRNRNFLYEGQVLALAASARVAPPVEASVPVETVAPPVATVAERNEEPVSEREAEEISPALVTGMQAAASADPSDYSVRDKSVRVQAAETIGHYADWLEVRPSRLRQLNRMTAASPVVIGRRLKLDFSKVSPDEFEAKRIDYHRQLQEAFFTQYRISGRVEHQVKAGESVWVLAQQRYNVPIWLLRQYNPDLDMGSVRAGVKLVIPTVEQTASGAEPATGR
jgi:membrane-bound lytic murein transglycosylase D